LPCADRRAGGRAPAPPLGFASLRGEQCASDRNLSARIGLHQRFSTNPESWYAWLLRQLELAPGVRVLDIGCGNAALRRSTAQP
jgi:2-polyprenyl-3-methyl-5-hydroxy-6-metoxy-1,4-benzoquinol methylase